jgi:hypothetical protein
MSIMAWSSSGTQLALRPMLDTCYRSSPVQRMLLGIGCALVRDEGDQYTLGVLTAVNSSALQHCVFGTVSDVEVSAPFF